MNGTVSMVVAGLLASSAVRADRVPHVPGHVAAVSIPAPSLHEGGRNVLVYLPPSYDRAESARRRYPVLARLHGEPGGNLDWPLRVHIDALLDSLIARRRIPEVLVYLPPSYDRPESARRRYPVLELLHGEPGGNLDWPLRVHIDALLDSLIARRPLPEVLVRMPAASGRGPGRRSLYLNSFDGRLRMEDFIVGDVLDWADRHLRTRTTAVARAIVGVSDGANAALNIAFKHPDRFGACAGHSGEYIWKHTPEMPAVLGPEPGASRLLAENSPLRSE